jgi:hypothetical protein
MYGSFLLADFDPKLMWVEEQGSATTAFQIAILCANTSVSLI